MALSKKLRFEVFKRDSFTCQYCGKSAPDVILHVDHIDPKSRGGKDSITNLITSCKDCNLGKKDVRLDDSMAVTKQKKQLDLLQERRAQLKMMMQWQDELLDLESQQVEYLGDLWIKLCDYQCELSEYGLKEVKKILGRFGFTIVCDAMKIAATNYLQYHNNCEPTKESRVNAFNKISGIAYNIKRNASDPDYAYMTKAISLLTKKFPSKYHWQFKDDIMGALKSGRDPEHQKIMALAYKSKNYSEWQEGIQILSCGA